MRIVSDIQEKKRQSENAAFFISEISDPVNFKKASDILDGEYKTTTNVSLIKQVRQLMVSYGVDNISDLLSEIQYDFE